MIRAACTDKANDPSNSRRKQHACKESNLGHSASKASAQAMPRSPRSVDNSQAHARRGGVHKARAVRVLTSAWKKRGAA